MDRKTGRLIDGIPEIEQSLDEIARTVPGDRVMRAEFGSGVYELVDVGFDASGAAAISGAVTDDVRRWEPRVRVRKVQRSISPDGTVRTTTQVVVRTTGEGVEVRR